MTGNRKSTMIKLTWSTRTHMGPVNSRWFQPQGTRPQSTLHGSKIVLKDLYASLIECDAKAEQPDAMDALTPYTAVQRLLSNQHHSRSQGFWAILNPVSLFCKATPWLRQAQGVLTEHWGLCTLWLILHIDKKAEVRGVMKHVFSASNEPSLLQSRLRSDVLPCRARKIYVMFVS